MGSDIDATEENDLGIALLPDAKHRGVSAAAKHG